MTEGLCGSVMKSAGLTKTEQVIFAYLVENANMRVSRHAILSVLKASAPHTIDSHIMAIRRKLQRSGARATVETVVGYGFILHVQAE